jgi:hypothetical protein
MSQGPVTAPASPAPLDPVPPELLEPASLEPESLLDVELPLELLEAPPELELPLDPELPELTLESRPSGALEPELPPEPEVAPDPEVDPPRGLEGELGVSPEPHAQKVAATTATAMGASVRDDVFVRTSERRAVCTIDLKVTAGPCFRPRKAGGQRDPGQLVRHARKPIASRKS